MKAVDNFYLYAKYVYYYEGKDAGLDIINQHFIQKNKHLNIKKARRRDLRSPLRRRQL